jgi:hypothetical protein
MPTTALDFSLSNGGAKKYILLWETRYVGVLCTSMYRAITTATPLLFAREVVLQWAVKYGS